MLAEVSRNCIVRTSILTVENSPRVREIRVGRKREGKNEIEREKKRERRNGRED